MVALLRPQPEVNLHPRQLRLVVDNVANNGPVVECDRAESPVRLRAAVAPVGIERMVMVAIVVAAVVVFGALALVRTSQGSATAGSWAGVDAAASSSVAGSGSVGVAAVVSAPGDVLYIAKPGDSLWSIAEAFAPDSDPRPVVATLIEVNGGASLQIGQQIVIPEQLLD